MAQPSRALTKEVSAYPVPHITAPTTVLTRKPNGWLELNSLTRNFSDLRQFRVLTTAPAEDTLPGYIQCSLISGTAEMRSAKLVSAPPLCFEKGCCEKAPEPCQ
jgi:hypothetical protein